MKIFFSILLLVLSSCGVGSDISRGFLTVDIIDRNLSPVGKWVRIDSEHVLTASHVYEKCAPSCSVDGSLAHSGWSIPEKDIAIIRTSHQDASPIIYSFPWLHDVVMISGSGWVILTGTVLSLSGNYIGYDTTLSGRVISGAIETDIVLSPGESGSPVWTVRGELIWVMSAVDTEGKRWWVVRP